VERLVADLLDTLGPEEKVGLDLAHRILDETALFFEVIGQARPRDTVALPDDQDVALGLDVPPLGQRHAVGLDP
jgi:hypothetical protein